MVYFYMIILTYTPNERDIIKMHQILFFRVFNENTQKKEYIFSKKYLFLSFETMSNRQHD